MSEFNALMERAFNNFPKPERNEEQREVEQQEGDNTVHQAVVEIEQPEEEEYDEPAEQIKEVVVPDEDEEETPKKKTRDNRGKRKHRREKKEIPQEVDERKLRNPNASLLEGCEKVTPVTSKITQKIKRSRLPDDERELLEQKDEEMRDQIEEEQDEHIKRRNAEVRLRCYRDKYPERFPEDLDISSLETEQIIKMGDEIGDVRCAKSWEAITKKGYHATVSMIEAYGPTMGLSLNGLTKAVENDVVINNALEDIAIEYSYLAQTLCNPFIALAIGTITLACVHNTKNKAKEILNPDSKTIDFTQVLSNKEYNGEI